LDSVVTRVDYVDAARRWIDRYAAGLPELPFAIGGIGAARLWVQISRSSRIGIDPAVRAMVSRDVVAANLPLANRAALQGFSLSATFSKPLAQEAGFISAIRRHLLLASRVFPNC